MKEGISKIAIAQNESWNRAPDRGYPLAARQPASADTIAKRERTSPFAIAYNCTSTHIMVIPFPLDSLLRYYVSSSK